MSWHQDGDGFWRVTCDTCATDWFDEWDATSIRFTDRPSLAAFAQVSGWDLTPERILCSGCSLAQLCARLGHQWGEWTQLEPSPLSAEPVAGRVRFCRICTAGEYDTSLPRL